MTATTAPTDPAAERADVLADYRRHVGAGAAALAEALALPVEARSEGAYLWDTAGRRYLQCGGYGVFILGHRPAPVVAALHRQLDRHPMSGRLLLSAELAEAAAALVAVTPDGLERVYFGCTGAEAVETALKLARANGRRRIVAMTGGFHGKTLGALSVTDRMSFRVPFKPLLPDVERVPYGDVDALRATLRDGPPACVIVEPVQGEGGVRIPPDGYLAATRDVTAEHGALLVVDEIQTGLGRLGRWWGWPDDAGTPDLLLVGKALGGGCVPVSAVLSTAEVFRPLDRNPRLHTSTFSGYPLGMAAVTATLRHLQAAAIPDRAASLGRALLAGVREAAMRAAEGVVRDVRGRGLLVGVELARPEQAAAFTAALVGNGVLPTSSLGADTVVRLCPPAVLDDADLDTLIRACAAAFAALRPGDGRTGPASGDS
ncbi:putrescine aminotransferase [Jatrophihabitans endophyticus]|uniref:Putrescine aminotransferase n=1 Tax=Jatrophihabitans endophyticus TaxID=1206085 RepID=A0A1M5RE54_9ACTN|nr:aminotransferase class III-fold pyridoxal phosphate-dependent enzyme [Jatrophihabitans endophyticus]SHH24605.1 putrescine aminotransferase [Jatrophihabitans endophyticus]